MVFKIKHNNKNITIEQVQEQLKDFYIDKGKENDENLDLTDPS